MGYKTAYREIMRGYEMDRDRAAALAKSRLEVVYQRIPRIRDIDASLAETGASLVKRIVAGEADGQALAARLKDEAAALRAEKSALLREHGIAEDYCTAVYRCGACNDTGYVQTPEGLSERCVCLKQKLIDKYYDLSNLKSILAVENFDTFDMRYYDGTVLASEGMSPNQNMQTIYSTAMKFVMTFEEQFQNLLFYGETGLGKTFLCNCVAKDLLDKGHTVLYVTAPNLFKTIEDYRFNRDEMEEPDDIVDTVLDVDLLILDDLGTEFATVVTSAALFNIINQRLLNRKPIVISTNLPPTAFGAQYSERVVSRFWGHYKMLKFFGDDIRVKKKYAGK